MLVRPDLIQDDVFVADRKILLDRLEMSINGGTAAHGLADGLDGKSKPASSARLALRTRSAGPCSSDMSL